MKRRTLILIIIFVIVVGGASIAYYYLGSFTDFGPQVTSQDGETESSETAQAPDFAIYDSSGNTVTIEDFKGKPIVMNFWASWCGPCRSEMDGFDQVYSQFGDEVHFVMVNLTDGSRETEETAMELIDEKGYEFPVYFDKDMTACSSYQAYSIPMTYFIDADGTIIASATGAIDVDTLREGISMIHEEK